MERVDHTDLIESRQNVDMEAIQRRTLNVLRVSVVPGQAAVAGVVAVVSLLGKDMLGNDRLAGLGSAAFTLGSALIAIPLSVSMRRRGRRPGLVAALLLGMVGSAVAATGGQLRWFWLFIVGMMMFGFGQSATLQARYVAADLAKPEDRAKSIGAIVWIGTLGAVFGPIMTPWEKRVGQWFGLDEFVGPFLFAGLLFGLGALVYWRLLRPDPLVVAGGTDPHAERVRPIVQVRRSYASITASSGAMLGLVAMAASQAVMVGVMTMTPPHMKDHGQADLSAYVIALHILGMYGLSPWVGRFVARVGAVMAIQLGAIVIGAGAALSVVAGYVPSLIFAGLFLLGAGWSLGLIAGSTLLTASVPFETRVEAQGTGDLTLSLCGATAAFASGFIKSATSFHVLANIATVLAAGLLVFGWLTGQRMRRTGQLAAA